MNSFSNNPRDKEFSHVKPVEIRTKKIKGLFSWNVNRLQKSLLRKKALAKLTDSVRTHTHTHTPFKVSIRRQTAVLLSQSCDVTSESSVIQQRSVPYVSGRFFWGGGSWCLENQILHVIVGQR